MKIYFPDSNESYEFTGKIAKATAGLRILTISKVYMLDLFWSLHASFKNFQLSLLQQQFCETRTNKILQHVKKSFSRKQTHKLYKSMEYNLSQVRNFLIYITEQSHTPFVFHPGAIG